MRQKVLAVLCLVCMTAMPSFGQKKAMARLTARLDSLEMEVSQLKSANVLWGKKYVSCGDSFTNRTWKLNDPSGEAVYDSLWNCAKTYPYWIARRNSMKLVNLGVSGSTMSNYDNDAKASFCLKRYLEVPEDADYITLCFGINDSHKNVAVGTIDDTCDTTFCGAYNKVLSYLTQKCPFAKIGIIVTNGLDSNAYADATIAIARKWGIPYLNMVYGENVPVMHRVDRPGLSADVFNEKMKSFVVDMDKDRHPNLKAHEYESTFIENFLRSL